MKKIFITFFLLTLSEALLAQSNLSSRINSFVNVSTPWESSIDPEIFSRRERMQSLSELFTDVYRPCIEIYRRERGLIDLGITKISFIYGRYAKQPMTIVKENDSYHLRVFVLQDSSIDLCLENLEYHQSFVYQNLRR